jgi:hypothetical protein
MKRLLTLALAAGLLLGAMTVPAQAAPGRACTGWQYQVRRTTPPAIRERRVARLIRCVFNEVGIGGQAAYAVVIADRESGLAPWAYNSSSCASGLFQHICSYWPGRAHALPRAQFPRWPDSSVFRARANVWAAARMVKAGGWGAWTTAS